MGKVALIIVGVALIGGSAVVWGSSFTTSTPANPVSISIQELHQKTIVKDLPVLDVGSFN